MGLIEKYSNNYMRGKKNIFFLVVGFHRHSLKFHHSGMRLLYLIARKNMSFAYWALKYKPLEPTLILNCVLWMKNNSMNFSFTHSFRFSSFFIILIS